jgi:Tfp pilus assembly protein PilZ
MTQTAQETEDNRIFDRFSVRFPAKLKDSREEYGEKIHLKDASAEGLRIFSKDRFYINDSVSLEIKLPQHKNPVNLHGEVIWTKRTDADIWDIGLKFHRIDLFGMSRLYESVA